MFMVKRKTIYKWLFSFFWDWSKVIQYTPTEMFKIKMLITPNADTHSIMVGMQKWYNRFGK